ncbi:hypothetical protein DXG01_014081 [Tephrocybe rancida]|nr:hypothetical protein DXG01_014081 [Tephrocybe rancida]
MSTSHWPQESIGGMAFIMMDNFLCYLKACSILVDEVSEPDIVKEPDTKTPESMLDAFILDQSTYVDQLSLFKDSYLLPLRSAAHVNDCTALNHTILVINDLLQLTEGVVKTLIASRQAHNKAAIEMALSGRAMSRFRAVYLAYNREDKSIKKMLTFLTSCGWYSGCHQGLPTQFACTFEDKFRSLWKLPKVNLATMILLLERMPVEWHAPACGDPSQMLDMVSVIANLKELASNDKALINLQTSGGLGPAYDVEWPATFKMIKGEIQYYHDLVVLYKVFSIPLAEGEVISNPSERTTFCRTVFLNVEVLMRLSERFLDQLLTFQWAMHHLLDSIFPIVLRFVSSPEYLAAMKAYMINYPLAKYLVDQLAAANEPFQLFLLEVAHNALNHVQDVTSHVDYMEALMNVVVALDSDRGKGFSVDPNGRLLASSPVTSSVLSGSTAMHLFLTSTSEKMMIGGHTILFEAIDFLGKKNEALQFYLPKKLQDGVMRSLEGAVALSQRSNGHLASIRSYPNLGGLLGSLTASVPLSFRETAVLAVASEKGLYLTCDTLLEDLKRPVLVVACYDNGITILEVFQIPPHEALSPLLPVGEVKYRRLAHLELPLLTLVKKSIDFKGTHFIVVAKSAGKNDKESGGISAVFITSDEILVCLPDYGIFLRADTGEISHGRRSWLIWEGHATLVTKQGKYLLVTCPTSIQILNVLWVTSKPLNDAATSPTGALHILTGKKTHAGLEIVEMEVVL